MDEPSQSLLVGSCDHDVRRKPLFVIALYEVCSILYNGEIISGRGEGAANGFAGTKRGKLLCLQLLKKEKQHE
jgi:hypothetical protein